MSATETLTAKRQAYLDGRVATLARRASDAKTAFKRHEAFGWHLLIPFTVGASEEEKAIILAGENRYSELRAACMRAKRSYKNARYAANRLARASTSSTTSSDSAPEVEEPQPAPQPKTYHELVQDNWESQNANFRDARSKFRRFAVAFSGTESQGRSATVKDGLATFVVAKDGANYEGLSMNVEDLLMPGLRLWASILQVPYASRMVRAELEKVLQPVLATLAQGPTPSRWVYL